MKKIALPVTLAIVVCTHGFSFENLVTNGTFQQGSTGWHHFSVGSLGGGGSLFLSDFPTLIGYSGIQYDDQGNPMYGDGGSALFQHVERVPANTLIEMAWNQNVDYLNNGMFFVQLFLEDTTVYNLHEEYGYGYSWSPIARSINAPSKRVLGIRFVSYAFAGPSDGYVSASVDDVQLFASGTRYTEFQNPDFEELPAGPGPAQWVPGWTTRFNADLGILSLTAGNYDWIPSGQSSLFVNNWETPVSQQVDRRFEFGQRYRFRAMAGHSGQTLRANQGRMEIHSSRNIIDALGFFTDSRLVAQQSVAGRNARPGEIPLSPRSWVPVEIEVTPALGDPILGGRIGVSFVTTDRSEGPVGWDNFRMEVIPLPNALRGRLRLNDYTPTRVLGTPIDLEVRGATTERVRVLLAADGAFETRLASSGPVTVYAKGPHWLRRNLGSVTLSASGTPTLGPRTLVNGDVDGDNAVTVFDYDALSAAFDAGPSDAHWNPNADLDGDDRVTVFDYDILSTNFDQVGD